MANHLPISFRAAKSDTVKTKRAGRSGTKVYFFPVLWVALTACCTNEAWAQAVWGRINGTVIDPSGAIVSGAKIVAINVATNVETDTATTETGNYAILHLVPGSYRIKIEMPGFRRFVRENIIVSVDSIARVDVQLEVGETSSEITVAGAAPLLQADKVELATVLSEKQVQELPTLGRNMSRLVQILPGALPATGQLQYHVENMVEDYRVGVNGQIWGNNNRQIDGVDNNETIQGSAIIVPTSDSVAEMKVSTNSYDAEFGQVAGAIIETVTKSGTNTLHGSAFEYHRNSATFARNPLTEANKPAPFKWNQFGGSLGGPVARDKFFFFGDYQGTRQRLGSTLQSTVPVDAFRRGDFSALPQFPIFDPLTGDENGRGRSRFTNNIIPSNRINPTAANLFALLPSPTDPSRFDQNYTRSDVTKITTDQISGRVDYVHSSKTRMFARYTFFDSGLDTPALYGDIAGGPAFGFNSYKDATTRSQNLAFNYQRTITTTFLTEARFGFSRFRAFGALRDSELNTANQVGLPGINQGDILTGGLPGLSIAGPVGSFSFGNPAAAPFSEREQTLQFVSNWNKISGSQTLKWGADVRRAMLKRFAQNGRGNLVFNQNVTGSAEVQGSGLGLASFLLGGVQSFTRDLKVERANEQQTRIGLYFNDQWHATPNLTINFGVRWELFTPISADKPGGITNLDLSTGEVLFNEVGSINSSAGLKADYNNFGPRFGIAYRMGNKTVIRAGYGLSYALNVFGSNFGTMSQQWPNTASQDVTASTLFTSAFLLNQGPPAPPLPLSIPASGRLALPNGVGFIGFAFENETDNIHSWNFAIQRELAPGLSAEIAYVGNVGRNIFWNLNPNLPVPGPGAANPRRPYFQKFGWTQNFTLRTHDGRSNFNSLQAKIDKRFVKGYSILGSFTWQKALDYGTNGAINRLNWQGDYGLADNDRALYAQVSHLWELPFRAQGPARHLVEGWQFTGIVVFASGRPFTPTLANTASLNSPGVTLRPDRGGSGEIANPTRNQWFDFRAFSIPAPFVYGNAGRNILRGPGLANFDWGINKNFRITEAVSLKFRWEMFNVFNQTNLSQPVSTVDSSTAGQILSLFPGFDMRRMQFGLHFLW